MIEAVRGWFVEMGLGLLLGIIRNARRGPETTAPAPLGRRWVLRGKASRLMAEDHPKGAHQSAIPVFFGRRLLDLLDLHFGVGIAPLSPCFADRIGAPVQGDAQHSSPLLFGTPGGFMDLLYCKERLPRPL